MTSPVKLPPLPLEVESVYVDVDGLSTYREARDCYYTMDQMHAYAEQAIRQALAAQEPVAWLYHDGKPGVVPNPRDMCTSVLVTMSRQPWCRNETPLAIIPENSDG